MKNYIKYKDESAQGINGYSISDDIIEIRYDKGEAPRIVDDGFVIYAQNGTIIADGSEFVYRYDVLNAETPTQPYTVAYTNNPQLKQTRPYLTQEQMDADAADIPVEPLSNEELTEMVGGLLYETSLMQIGLTE